MSSATCGSLVQFTPKEGQEEALTKLFLHGYELAHAEPATLQWCAFKIAPPSPIFIGFDTFAAPEGRQAHFEGEFPKALIPQAPALLSVPLDISNAMIDVLASKVTKVVPGEKPQGGLKLGLWIVFTAKPEKKQAVREFLINALPLVEAEPGTAVWYAINWPGSDDFCILDLFASEEGREAHLNGKVAEALFASVDELLTGAPTVNKLNVLAAYTAP